MPTVVAIAVVALALPAQPALAQPAAQAVRPAAQATVLAVPARTVLPAAYTPPPMPAKCAKIHWTTINGRRLVKSAFCGRKLTSVEIVSAFRRAGVPWGPQMTRAVTTALAESGGYSQAVFYNRDPRTGAIRSTDTGFMQINDAWHPEIMRDRWGVQYSANVAWKIARRTGWDTWNGYTINGKGYTAQANTYIAWARRAGVR